MPQRDIAKKIYAVSNVLSDQQKISAENQTQPGFALDEVSEQKAHGQKAAKALSCVWQNKNQS